MSRIIKNPQFSFSSPLALEPESVFSEISRRLRLSTTDEPVVDADSLEVNFSKIAPAEILESARTEADELVGRAYTEAQGILNEAHREAELIRQGALAERENMLSAARAEGYQAGKDEAREHCAVLYAQAEREIEQAITEKAEIIDGAQEELILLVGAALERILPGAVETNPDTIILITKQALSTVVGAGRIAIRAHPQDTRLLEKHKRRLITVLGQQESLAFVPDDTVSLGGCIIETAQGYVDARIEGRLDAVKKALWEVILRE